MKTWKTEDSTVYQVLKGRSNSFLVKCKNNYLLVDTGRKGSWKKLTTKLEDILDVNKLSYLILTHTHFDHAENAAELKNKYNCKIICHESEADNLKCGDNTLPQGTNPITRFGVNLLGKSHRKSTIFGACKKLRFLRLQIFNLQTPKILRIFERLQKHYKYEPAYPDIIIDKNLDLSQSGFHAYIIHTPGHSRGSISVIVDKEVAIIGDTAFGVFPNFAYPPFADNQDIMVESWKNCLKLIVRYF
ncbi:MBL fold metallo-hydrolase [Methanobacterium sp. ACI-7]|uniref:MBL fold metallo-hydrolase n=1 Tax=unclassified Methanobacterium TaxID=2627676 RepID=UPI0039C4555F